MIYIVCKSCPGTLRVSPGADAEGGVQNLLVDMPEWHPDEYPCPFCGGHGEFVEAIDSAVLRTRDVHDVTPLEAFVALNGAGLPEEKDCGTTAVEQVFLKKVKSVATRLIHNSKRCAIDYIEFEDGTRAYFGASSHGAIIYRISRPGHYAERVTS